MSRWNLARRHRQPWPVPQRRALLHRSVPSALQSRAHSLTETRRHGSIRLLRHPELCAVCDNERQLDVHARRPARRHVLARGRHFHNVRVQCACVWDRWPLERRTHTRRGPHTRRGVCGQLVHAVRLCSVHARGPCHVCTAAAATSDVDGDFDIDIDHQRYFDRDFTPTFEHEHEHEL
jgi:hypothetical protein